MRTAGLAPRGSAADTPLMFRTAHRADSAARIALAVEETVTSPLPGIGHGRAADAAAVLTYLLSMLHLF